MKPSELINLFNGARRARGFARRALRTLENYKDGKLEWGDALQVLSDDISCAEVEAMLIQCSLREEFDANENRLVKFLTEKNIIESQMGPMDDWVREDFDDNERLRD